MAKSTKASFKESVESCKALCKQVESGKFAPIYLLMGEEPYFIDMLSDLLAEKILTPDQRAFNQTVVYGKDCEVGNVINLCRQSPMMGGYQVVIIKEAQAMRKLDQMNIYATSPSATTIVIICHKEKTVDKRLQFYKSCNDKGVVFESVRARDYEIAPWISEFIASKGCKIEPKALSMVADHLGTGIAKITNEIDKLLTFLPSGTTMITADHVEQNIGISKDFNIFELTKAMSERNMFRAMLIADHFARNQKDNPLVMTISSLFTHFQRIFIINYERWLVARGKAAMPSDMELARILKLGNPFFVKEYQQAAGLYPNTKVFGILGLIREYDAKSKGMDSGSADNGELLKELLLKIFAA